MIGCIYSIIQSNREQLCSRVDFIRLGTARRNSPEVGVEHLPEDGRHEAVDEEVDGGVDDHEQLRDDAPPEGPDAYAVAVVLDVLGVLLYREDLRENNGPLKIQTSQNPHISPKLFQIFPKILLNLP